ncbi:MAG: PLP-dependent transferase [Paludibacteraceae bacterium]|nr:PLP-dependent transferase [Paludibacteraceae bacterium]MBR4840689.1 PLP-dependent transferase [Paludibacteraceae bacterium]
MALGFSTRAIHNGEEPDFREGASGDVAVPIHLATTFARRKAGSPTAGYEYTRSLNPTRKALEEKLAALDGAKYGLAFSSGLAAASTLIISLLKAGDHVIGFDDLYGGTRRLLSNVFVNFNISVSYVDATVPENVEKAIRPESKLIWIESPTNPLLKIADIRAIAKIAKSHGLILVVDNTFLSPYFQKPLGLGADVVVYSTTKYIGGHSDALGGSIVLNNEEYYKKIAYNQNAVGAVLSPFDSYLTLRGAKTLAVRMEQHQKNALALAEFLQTSPKVKRVLYPGLKYHPHHNVATSQAIGFGGVLSFELEGTLADAENFLSKLKLFSTAESLGGVESLAEIPAIMTHASVPKEVREKNGISDTLIRISVGIENTEDLIEDFRNALK